MKMILALVALMVSSTAFADLTCSKRGAPYLISVSDSGFMNFSVNGEAKRVYRVRGNANQYLAKEDRGQEYVIEMDYTSRPVQASVRFFGWDSSTSAQLLNCKLSKTASIRR